MESVDLRRLYQASAESMLFGIGLLDIPGRQPAPFIQIHYPSWSYEELAMVRGSFRSGIRLNTRSRSLFKVDLYLSSREQVEIRADHRDQVAILRAPAWSADLNDIDADIHKRFTIGRDRVGAFALLLQTPRWELLSTVDDQASRDHSDLIHERRFPLPPSSPAEHGKHV